MIIGLEVKLSASYAKVEQTNLELREAIHKVNQSQLIAQAEKLQIEYLISEKTHLEEALQEN